MSAIPPHVNPELIRRYADGELGADELKQLEQDVPAHALDRAVSFERALRSNVGRVMSSSTAAPAALRNQVTAAMAAENAADGHEPVGRIEPSGASVPPVETTGAGRFSRANILAVAASLVLIAGAVLFGIYGKPIDQWSQNTASTAGEVSEFVSSEHDRCAFSDKVRQEKIDITEQNACCSKVSSLLGLHNRQVTMFDLSEPALEYSFIGAGECHVPNYERSAHLMFKRVREGTVPAMASIFVCSKGSAAAKLAPGEWMELPETTGCTHAVFTSTDGSVDYLLVCCDADDLERLRASIGRQLRKSCELSTPTK